MLYVGSFLPAQPKLLSLEVQFPRDASTKNISCVCTQRWRTLKPQGYWSTPQTINELRDWILLLRRQLICGHCWTRMLTKRDWKAKILEFVNDWEKDEDKDFGNRNICDKGGLFSKTFKWCRKERIFLACFVWDKVFTRVTMTIINWKKYWTRAGHGRLS